jgi:hypothetical protein
VKYTATAVQLALGSSFVAGQGFDPARFAANFDHTEAVLRRLAGETGSQLYLLPEFSFQGWAMGVPLEQWNAAAVRMPGPETERIGRLARELGAWIAGTLFEAIPEFPGRHFLTGFVDRAGAARSCCATASCMRSQRRRGPATSTSAGSSSSAASRCSRWSTRRSAGSA